MKESAAHTWSGKPKGKKGGGERAVKRGEKKQKKNITNGLWANSVRAKCIMAVERYYASYAVDLRGLPETMWRRCVGRSGGTCVVDRGAGVWGARRTCARPAARRNDWCRGRGRVVRRPTRARVPRRCRAPVRRVHNARDISATMSPPLRDDKSRAIDAPGTAAAGARDPRNSTGREGSS